MKVVVAQRRSVEIPEQQNAQIGAVVDHRSPYARLFVGLGVVVLLVAVDTQEVATGVGAAGDVDPVRGGDLDVAVGQAAGQFLQLPRPPGQRGDLLEQVVELGVSEQNDIDSL